MFTGMRKWGKIYLVVIVVAKDYPFNVLVVDTIVEDNPVVRIGQKDFGTEQCCSFEYTKGSETTTM